MKQITLPLAPAIAFTRHPRARRYIVRVAADGSVRVTIPRWGSRTEAQAFADRQRAWIDKQLVRMARERATGKEALAPEALLELRARAERELPARLHELARVHRLTVRSVTVRSQRWRWGSCSRGGRISLNWRLVRMPDWVRDYVMIHELMHLKRMDHSAAFWALVARACPTYDDARRWLRSQQSGLS